VIIDRIANGSWPAGRRLPSEDSLVQEFAVSRTTIRAAIQSLVQRGLVEIRRGKGTFVTQLARRSPVQRKGGSRK